MGGLSVKAPGVRRRPGRVKRVPALLPAEGRAGAAPRWPLSGRAQKGWAELWRLPQAVIWERQQSDFAVARYLRLRNAVDDVGSAETIRANLLAELRHLETSLGLNHKGLQVLGWEIVASEGDVA
ncbi:MAG: hypothetical protein HLX46_11495 [Corynebacterium sp.]|uniref:hypothetical protein n=1 Tax=Corynebacterium sp. TaxID=1720 RepID=UPI0018217099|nr:hypothetical protein [Corynebacterium sp.]NWO17426.1 hypothetical protein [Corynebacterium sp.]